MCNDTDSHKLLAIITAIHHKGIGETLDYRALGLPESLDSIAASRVGDIDWRPDLNVVAVVVIRVSESSDKRPLNPLKA